MTHRYQLEAYHGPQSRHTCPKCKHRGKTFKRYIDMQTNTHLADHVGRCDRQESCGYHHSPRQFFKASQYNPGTFTYVPPVNRPPKPFSTIPNTVMETSLRRYEENIFYCFLADMLGMEAALNLMHTYKIGTASHWPGATVFWQIDTQGRVRTGKIMLYNAERCKRVKQPYNHIAWAHGLLRESVSRQSPVSPQEAENHLSGFRSSRLSDYQLQQCLFGEHLLAAEPFKTVAIVESEKTAVIASHYNPQYIWLAAGSLDGLNAAKCAILANRTIILYPDVNGYPKWRQKAHELNLKILTANFSISETLIKHATPYDFANGNDIADQYIDEVLMQRQMIKEWVLRDVDGEEVE